MHRFGSTQCKKIISFADSVVKILREEFSWNKEKCEHSNARAIIDELIPLLRKDAKKCAKVLSILEGTYLNNDSVNLVENYQEAHDLVRKNIGMGQ
jgi:hypothetical protein